MTVSKYNVEAEKKWLFECFGNLTDEIIDILPSEWAEQDRYLPASVGRMSGFFSWDVTPFLREIVDCMAPDSGINLVDFMKPVQIGATVGILENGIGYVMVHIKTAPAMLLTADAELAKERMDLNVIPMINNSGLDKLIKTSDVKSTTKTGKTAKKIEWEGGGYLLPVGALNANKLKSISIQFLFEDEVDTYPPRIGKSGDPAKLAEDRTASYEGTKKIIRIGTPLITQTSRILRGYNAGDKRKYYIPCKHCKKMMLLSWTGHREDGSTYGIKWELGEDDILIPESVVYECEFCRKTMKNHDKSYFLILGKWKPTKKPISPNRRSYHLNGLYSPVGFRSWETIVELWLECWDVKTNKPKDINLLQQFWNHCLGRPFEQRGEQLKFEAVALHRRMDYASGTIPNILAKKEGGKILFLTCSVDIHDKHLDLQIIGWCRAGRFYSIDWQKIEGICEDLNSVCWEKLREILKQTFVADDGSLYKIQITLVDSQYKPDTVYTFCSEYSSGVYPIAGRQSGVKGKMNEFSEFESKMGTRAFNINTTLYKDRLAAALKREWSGLGIQPAGYPNFPTDYPEKFFKEFTAEAKKPLVDKRTGQQMGFFWHCSKGVDNHSWDLTVYGSAALDMVAWETCTKVLELETVEWGAFWDVCENEELYFESQTQTG